MSMSYSFRLIDHVCMTTYMLCMRSNDRDTRREREREIDKTYVYIYI